jgi:superfamily II DNA or RNA helicase
MSRPHAHLVFDRGTVVVELDRPTAPTIPGLLWDGRVSAYRAPAHHHQRLREALARAGFDVIDEVMAHGEPPAAWLRHELRPYQEAAIDAWELRGRRGTVVLPTGAGKTHVAIAIMARTGLRTLCLVPTRALVEQWIQQIARFYPGPLGWYGDGRRDLAPVTVSTFESAYRHMERLGNQFELLVIDEAHHFGTGVRDEALEMAAASARLGLTATPRTSSAESRFGELVGGVVFELAIGDLMGSFLATFDVITLHLELGPAERAIYDRLQTAFMDVHREFRRRVPNGSWADFVRIASRTDVGRAALAAGREARHLVMYPESKRHAVAALLARHRDARVLVFTADNETAYAISREHLVMPLTCDIGRQERTAALDRFREGTLRVLVSARVLNEGIDVPEADVAIIVGGTQGEREHVQRVGRLLRPRVGKRALVYELVCRATVETRQAQRRRRALAPQRTAQL